MAKKATKKIEGDILTIDFPAEGKTLTVDINELPPEIVSRLAMHGLSQKAGDSYAGADEGECYDKASGVVEDLKKGEWTSRVAASGPKATQLAEALAAATGKTIEEAAAKIESLDDEQKAALRKHPQIKVKLAEIKAAKAAEAAQKAAAEVADAPALEI